MGLFLFVGRNLRLKFMKNIDLTAQHFTIQLFWNKQMEDAVFLAKRSDFFTEYFTLCRHYFIAVFLLLRMNIYCSTIRYLRFITILNDGSYFTEDKKGRFSCDNFMNLIFDGVLFSDGYWSAFIFVTQMKRKNHTHTNTLWPSETYKS